MKLFSFFLTTAFFLGALFFGSFLHIVTDDRPISSVENRTLASFPSFSFHRLFSGAFFHDIEAYVSDQFPYRDHSVHLYKTINANIQSFSLSLLEKDEKINGKVSGDYYIREDGLILMLPQSIVPDPNMPHVLATKLNDFVKTFPSDAKVFYFRTPFKTRVLADQFPSYVSTKQDDEQSDSYYQQLNQNLMHKVDLDAAFKQAFLPSERLQYYFKTDHHWNADGAYWAYLELLKSLEEQDHSLSFDPIPKPTPTCSKELPFFGSWNRILQGEVKETTTPCTSIPSKKYTNTFIHHMTMNMDQTPANFDEVFGGFRTASDLTSIAYGNLFTWDLPRIDFDNPEAKNKKRILIFRDSYFSPLTPFVPYHFSHTTIADRRHLTNAEESELVQSGNYDYILFWYNSDPRFQVELFDDIKK